MRERFEATAERIAAFMGTPLFVILQTGFMACWVIGAGIILQIDPYPYILLTLMLSIEAIYLGCFILVSTNRSDLRHDDYEARDREHREQLFTDSAAREHATLELVTAVHELQRDVHHLAQQIHQHIAAD